MSAPRPYVAIFRPEGFSPQSGMEPVARELDAEFLEFAPWWERLQKRSWTLGNALRQWRSRYTVQHGTRRCRGSTKRGCARARTA